LHKDIEKEDLQLLKDTIKEFYGDKPVKSKDYGKIVSAAHVRRLKSLVQGQESTVILGNLTEDFDEAERTVGPIVLLNPKTTSKVMQEEIFGPILPVLTVDSVEEAVTYINNGEKPLAAYLFSTDKEKQELFIQRVKSGGMAINETVMHCICDELPFGGVGNSGMGAYNYKTSFDAFSHQKSLLVKGTIGDASFRYPPYTSSKINTVIFLQTLNLGKYKPLLWIGLLGMLSFLVYRFMPLMNKK
jgi:aldehyde dehydrogenase (NAD+)